MTDAEFKARRKKDPSGSMITVSELHKSFGDLHILKGINTVIKQGEKVIFIHTGGMPGLYTPAHRVEFEKELLDGVHIII